MVEFHKGASRQLKGMLPKRWIKEKELGSGTFGTVFRVRDTTQNPPQFYALKVVKWKRLWVSATENGGSSLQALESYTTWGGRVDELVQDLEDEAQLLSGLRHANIVAFAGMIHPDAKGRPQESLPFPGMLTHLCDGTLHDLYKDFPKNPNKSYVWTMFRHMISALIYIHDKGLIHQDIKPKNIFFLVSGRTRTRRDTARYTFVLGDFGMCRSVQESQGYNPGTRAYMAPEHRSSKPCQQSDLYSLYITLLVALNMDDLALRMGNQKYEEVRKMIRAAIVKAKPKLGDWEYMGRSDPRLRGDARSVYDQIRRHADFDRYL